MYVKIEKNPDGSHEFQSGGILQSGWAVIPSNMDIPATFPFINIEVAEVTHSAVTTTKKVLVNNEYVDNVIVLIPEYTQLEVISMAPGEEIPLEIEFTNTPQDDTDAMLIDHEYRLTLLELGLTEY